MRPRKTLVIAAVWTLCCGSLSAFAADPVSNPEAKRHAEASFAAGLRSYDAAERAHDEKLYNDAYYEFAKAFAIYPDDKVLWNLALSEVDTGRLLEGLRHLREYDRRQHVNEQPSHAKYKLLRDYVDRASRSTGHIVVTAPAGVPLRVDGQDLGLAPLPGPVDVLPGDHVVEAILPGGAQRKSVQAAPGQVLEVPFSAPIAGPPLPVASTVAPTPTVRENEALPSTWWTTSRVVGVGLEGIGVAGVVVGLVLRGSSSSEANHANQVRTDLPPGACGGGPAPAACGDLRDSLDAANRDLTLSTMSFVAAGAAVVGGLALIVFGDSGGHVRAGGVAWTPLIAPGSAGVGVSF